MALESHKKQGGPPETAAPQSAPPTLWHYAAVSVGYFAQYGSD
jgi:hypothetical protein